MIGIGLNFKLKTGGINRLKPLTESQKCAQRLLSMLLSEGKDVFVSTQKAPKMTKQYSVGDFLESHKAHMKRAKEFFSKDRSLSEWDVYKKELQAKAGDTWGELDEIAFNNLLMEH